MGMKTPHVTHQQASGLLHNKFVVVLGSSFQRGVYKDIVMLLQKDSYLSLSQLKAKGEEHFENDELLEGGRKGHMSNGTQYKEVRQYTSDHHLVRFYFITRVFSEYMQRVLEDLENGLKPDLVIVNSCVWDVTRYGRQWEPDYLKNLTTFFGKLRTILPEEALIIWNLTMPLGETIIGGFLVPEVAEFGPSLRFDIIEANYCSAMLASQYGLDVLDLHFQFRFSLQHRMKDGVHWNAVAHRRVTCLLLEQIADAWGVELPPAQPPKGLNQSFSSEDLATKAMYRQPRKAQISGVNLGFRQQDPAPNQQYQQPRNTQNSVTRWRVQDRMADCLPLMEIPTKAPYCYGGLNRHFSKQYPATMKMYQQPRNAPNSANDLRLRITRLRFQAKSGDHYLPPNSLLKNPPCYGGLSYNQSFNKQDPTTNEMYQQRRNAQNSVTSWSLQERRDDIYLHPVTPTKPSNCCRGLNQRFNEHDPSTSKLYQQPRNTPNADTSWEFQERRVNFHLPPTTPTKPSRCYGGLNQSFSDSAINEVYQQPRNAQNAVRHVSLVSQNRPDPATNDVYQQPRNAPNAVTGLRPQKRKADCYMTSTTHPKAPHCYGDESKHEFLSKIGLNQSFSKQDPATSMMYQQPRNTQDSVTRWRLQERRPGCYPLPDVPWKVPHCYGVTRSSCQERRDDFYLPPAIPTKPSPCYRGLNPSFSQDDPATRWITRESRNAQSSEPIGFDRCAKRPNYQHPYKEPRDPGFSINNHQCHPPNGNYVMRNKYTFRAQYRPY